MARAESRSLHPAASDRNGVSARDPLLRLKNGSARDDAGEEGACQNSHRAHSMVNSLPGNLLPILH
jgi:hypothetical protein